MCVSVNMSVSVFHFIECFFTLLSTFLSVFTLFTFTLVKHSFLGWRFVWNLKYTRFMHETPSLCSLSFNLWNDLLLVIMEYNEKSIYDHSIIVYMLSEPHLQSLLSALFSLSQLIWSLSTTPLTTTHYRFDRFLFLYLPSTKNMQCKLNTLGYVYGTHKKRNKWTTGSNSCIQDTARTKRMMHTHTHTHTSTRLCGLYERTVTQAQTL